MLELPNGGTYDRVSILEGADLNLVTSQPTLPTTDCVCWLQVNSSELQPKTSYYAQPFVPYGPLPVAPSTPLGSSVVSRFPPSVQSGMRAFPFSRSYSVSDLGDMSPGSTRAYCDLVCSEGNVPGTSPFMSTASEVGSFYASQRAWQSADGLNKTPNAMFCPDQEPSASFSQAAYSVTGSTTHLQALSTDPPSLLQTRSLIPAENTDRTLPSPGNPALNDTRNSDLMSVPVSHLSTETAGSKIAATVGPKTMVDAMNCNGNQSAVNPSQPTTTSSDLTMMGNYLTSSAPSSLPTSEPVDAGTTIESLDTASCLYNYNGNS